MRMENLIFSLTMFLVWEVTTPSYELKMGAALLLAVLSGQSSNH